MNQIFALFLTLMIVILISLLFERFDRKYDLRLKYFSVVAKNKFLYYMVLIFWGALLFCFIIFTDPMNHYEQFLFTIAYFSVFLCFYHHVRDWKMAHSIYIEHAKLLMKAKEKYRKKKKKR